MTEKVHLDHLVIALLAVAESGPSFEEDAAERLRALAEAIPNSEEGLAGLALEIHMIARDNVAYLSASRAWGELVPVRVGLELEEIKKTLPNPTEGPSTGIEPLRQTSEIILRDPKNVNDKETLLKKLAQLIRLSWPRSSQA